MDRNPETIQREIDQARDALASTLDELVDRVHPAKVAERTKTSIRAKLQTPAGKAAVGGAAGIVVLLVALRIRNARTN